MSDTPRTDAARIKYPDGSIIDLVPYGFVVPYDFARQLERENDSLRRAYVRPDDLREQLATKTATLERAEAILMRCFAHLGNELSRMPLNESAKYGVQEMRLAVAKYLDAARAASPEEGAK